MLAPATKSGRLAARNADAGTKNFAENHAIRQIRAVPEQNHRAGQCTGVFRPSICEFGITPMNVKLSRKSHDLFVSLFDANGRVTDSLRIAGHYSPDKTKSIEAVEFEDGTRWGFQELKAAKTLPYLIGPGRGGHSGPSIDYDRLLLQRK